jgi:methylthioribulose-1-phosphate dehydratase
MKSEDLFILEAESREVLRYPANPKYTMTQCYPLFSILFELGFPCVIHTHSQHAVMASLLWDSEFTITHMEMIKGMKTPTGRRLHYFDTLHVPIIDNTPQEKDLEPSLRKAIHAMRERDDVGCAVLVRRHGIFVWGSNWQDAKAQLECVDYLFEVGVKMKQYGLDCAVVPANSPYVNKE